MKASRVSTAPALGAGWTARVLVVVVLAAVTAMMVPATERAVPLVLLASTPIVTSIATLAVRRHRLTDRRLPHVLTVTDVGLIVALAATTPQLRTAVSVTALPLLLTVVVTGRLPDVVLTATGLSAVWLLTSLTAPPETSVVVAAAAVTGAALVSQGQRLQQVRAGAGQRIALLSGRSRAMLLGVAEALFVTTPDGVLIDANQAAEELATVPTTAGQRCGAAFGLQTDAGPLDCSSCPLLEAEGRDVEVWREDQDGERTTLIARAQPVLDRSGTVVEVLHSLRDVTEIARARDAQNVFLATASHELRTPLTVIRGSAETVLHRPELDPDQRDRLLRAVTTRAAELDRMITRLLETSRLRAGATRVAVSEVDLIAEITPRVATIDDAMPNHDCSWVVPDHVPTVLADPEALGVVIDHLLENAVKYQPDGGRIEVRVHVDEQQVSVAVRDHGIGMTVAQQERCFDRFWQADIGDRRRFGGSGVGLYLVRGLVLAMDGDIEVWSQPGRGSTFTVHLRRADATPPSGQTESAPATTGRPTMIEEFMAQVGVVSTQGPPRTRRIEDGPAEEEAP